MIVLVLIWHDRPRLESLRHRCKANAFAIMPTQFCKYKCLAKQSCYGQTYIVWPTYTSSNIITAFLRWFQFRQGIDRSRCYLEKDALKICFFWKLLRERRLKNGREGGGQGARLKCKHNKNNFTPWRLALTGVALCDDKVSVSHDAWNDISYYTQLSTVTLKLGWQQQGNLLWLNNEPSSYLVWIWTIEAELMALAVRHCALTSVKGVRKWSAMTNNFSPVACSRKSLPFK